MKTTILSSVPGLWNRLPLILRAIISGCAVSSAGVFTWGAMLAVLPAPWAILPMIAALWVFWKFFSGNWGSGARAKTREYNFRSTKLSPPVWKWGLAAAAFFVIIVQSSFVITFRLIQFPAAKFMADYKVIDTFPVWVAWAIIIMSSVVAAIAEEAGFRGYMQTPIEKKYGAGTAIIITSLIFTLIHLTHTWAFPIWPHIFFASVLLGMLAYKTGSLIPGIIGHAILDIFDYSFWWSDLTGGFQKQTIFATGIDLHFIVWVLVFILSVLGFLRAIRKLNAGCKNAYLVIKPAAAI